MVLAVILCARGECDRMFIDMVTAEPLFAVGCRIAPFFTAPLALVLCLLVTA